MAYTHTCGVIAALLAFLLQFGAGCAGAQYRPLIASGDGDEGCRWVEAVRSSYAAELRFASDTDSRLMWCCGPLDEPMCTEATFVESGGRQMKQPFHTGQPPMAGEAQVAGGTVMAGGAEVGRLLGFGWNFGAGFGHAWSTTASSDPGSDAHFDVELPGFEFRIFPANDFSFDFLWRIGNAAWASEEYSGASPFTMMFLTHFHKGRHSVAPGVIFGSYKGSSIKMVGFVARLGGEVTNPEKTFGFGVHFRPAVTLTGAPGSDPQPGLELLCEFNWNFYIPRPAGM